MLSVKSIDSVVPLSIVTEVPLSHTVVPLSKVVSVAMFIKGYDKHHFCIIKLQLDDFEEGANSWTE